MQRQEQKLIKSDKDRQREREREGARERERRIGDSTGSETDKKTET